MTEGKIEVSTPPPSAARRVGASFAAGSALAFAATGFFGPGIIGWWYEPPSKDAFSCAGSVRDALAAFVKFQLISAAGGGAAMLLIVYLVRRSLAERAARKVEPVGGAQ
jgi:hypothetical protein